MKFVLLHVSSSHEDWADAADELYFKKIKPFIPFEILELKPKKAGRDDAAEKKRAESESVLGALKPDDYVVVFDERGETLSSRQFAGKIEKILGSSKKRAVFIIGGAYGLSDEVLKRAQLRIRLSDLVFNHLIARTVALEQIYRGFTIIKNLPYHND